MKKVLFIFISIALITGCSNNPTTNHENFTYILFAAPLKEHPIWLRTKEGFMKSCEEEGFKCDWLGPSLIDTDAMNNVFKVGVLQKADAIITQGVVDEGLIAKAIEKGILVVLVDSDMKHSKRNVYFGKDFQEQAKILLNDIQSKWGLEKKLCITIQVAEASFAIADAQIQQIEEVFSQHPGGFEIVATTSSRSDKVRAKQEWESVLSSHPEVNVALSFASESVESCYESAQRLGIRNQLLIYGVDDLEPTLKLLQEEKIDGSIITPFYDYGYKTVKYIKENLQKPYDEEQDVRAIDIELLTPDTVKDYSYGT